MRVAKITPLRPFATVLFLTVELILFYLILTTGGTLNMVASFTSILICPLFCTLLFTKSTDFAFTLPALCFTVIADWFLVVHGGADKLSAMICFCAVQLLYCARLQMHQSSGLRIIKSLSLRLAFSLIFILAAFYTLGDKTDLLSIVSVFYYATLIFNIIEAIGQIRTSVLFPIGLILFLMCDTVIGLNVMAELYIQSFYESDLYSIINPGFNLAWMFYLPSQVLITLSLFKTHSEK
ncbi:MAG: hypothetical protein J6Q85_01215 [Clostridia bacterium]|nr:hypothetical protein [Clostridia bacterium]